MYFYVELNYQIAKLRTLRYKFTKIFIRNENVIVNPLEMSQVM